MLKIHVAISTVMGPRMPLGSVKQTGGCVVSSARGKDDLVYVTWCLFCEGVDTSVHLLCRSMFARLCSRCNHPLFCAGEFCCRLLYRQPMKIHFYLVLLRFHPSDYPMQIAFGACTACGPYVQQSALIFCLVIFLVDVKKR